VSAPLPLLRRRAAADVKRRPGAAVDGEAVAAATPIVAAVRTGGEAALRAYAERFGDVAPEAPLWHGRAALARTLASLPAADRERLERIAERIRVFAEAQRCALAAVTCLLYTSPSPRDLSTSRMPSSA